MTADYALAYKPRMHAIEGTACGFPFEMSVYVGEFKLMKPYPSIFYWLKVTMSSYPVPSVGSTGATCATGASVQCWVLVYAQINQNLLLIAVFLSMFTLALIARRYRSFASTLLNRSEINEADLHIPVHPVKHYQYDRVSD